jgi:co-chaperonin GroES (HSP10)
LVGTIRYINEQLESFGLKEGDEISFKPESEYEFTVDGEKLYRMFTDNITLSL